MESTFSDKFKNFLSCVNSAPSSSFEEVSSLLQAKQEYLLCVEHLNFLLKDSETQLEKAESSISAPKTDISSFNSKYEDALKTGIKERNSFNLCEKALEQAKTAFKCIKCTKQTDELISVCVFNHTECFNCAREQGDCVICLTPKQIKSWLERENILMRVRLMTNLSADLRKQTLKAFEGSDAVRDKVVLRTEEDTIVQVEWKDGEAVLRERRRVKEDSNFIFWFEEKQLCAEYRQLAMESDFRVWMLWFRQGTAVLDKTVKPSSDLTGLKFVKLGETVYLISLRPPSISILTFKSNEFDNVCIQNINTRTTAIFTHKNTLYFGTVENKIYSLFHNVPKVLFTTTATPCSIAVEDNKLYTSDLSGTIQIHNTLSNKRLRQFKMSEPGKYFILPPLIVFSSKNTLILYDLEGNFKSEFTHNHAKPLNFISSTSLFAVFNEGNCTVLLNRVFETCTKHTNTALKGFYTVW